MILDNVDSPPLEDISVTLNAQGEVIHLDLLGKRYSDFRVPFSRDEVEQALEDYAPNRIAVDPLVSFGSTLFNALFSAERGRALWDLLGQVTRENRALRLRILTNLERTQHLPWELLFDGSRNDFVSLSGRVALVRTRPDGYGMRRDGYDRTVQLPPLPRLRVLAVTADPDDSLRAAEDLAVLDELANAHSERIELCTLQQATKGQLKQTLARDHFDVFIFFGAGAVLRDISKAGGLRQALQLVAEADEDDGLVSRNKLGQDLRRAGVRLAVLNGSNSDWVARSLAKHTPASIGFRETMQRETRRVVVSSLFRALLGGLPLDLAVTAVRQAIDSAEPGTGEWCRLIFYLQPPDAAFLLPPPPRAVTPQREPLAGMSREVAKLVRLREVYIANLNSMELSSSGLSGDVWLKEADVLRDKINSLTQQINEAASIGPEDGS